MVGLLLRPLKVKWNQTPFAVVFTVQKSSLGPFYKNWRGMTLGHTVILNPKIENKDLEHELIHAEQYARLPIIFPFLYYIELLRKGYKGNKYEIEAYTKAGNLYKG